MSSEYLNAATRGGRLKYPYGQDYDSSKCPPSAYCELSQGSNFGVALGKLHPVQSVSSCQGGYPGVFDLAGNAAELLDACNLENPDMIVDGHVNGIAGCVVAGGADETGVTVAWLPKLMTDSNTGFRCCADTLEP